VHQVNFIYKTIISTVMYYRLKKKQKFNAIFTCAEKHMNKKRTV